VPSFLTTLLAVVVAVLIMIIRRLR